MDDPATKTRRRILEAGALVILHPDAPAGGFPLVAAVDQVSKGFHWFLGSIAPLAKGETLIVESPVPNDARYVTRGTIVAASPETFALRLEPEWQRVQQRAFVRITAHGLQVRVVRLDPPPVSDDDRDADGEASESGAVHPLVDVSAGGIRFATDVEYEPGEEVVCHFELPGSLCFVLPAEIVRSPESHPDDAGKSTVAVEFVGIDENTRSQLLRWVYREQVRRHREDQRDSR